MKKGKETFSPKNDVYSIMLLHYTKDDQKRKKKRINEKEEIQRHIFAFSFRPSPHSFNHFMQYHDIRIDGLENLRNCKQK